MTGKRLRYPAMGVTHREVAFVGEDGEILELSLDGGEWQWDSGHRSRWGIFGGSLSSRERGTVSMKRGHAKMMQWEGLAHE